MKTITYQPATHMPRDLFYVLQGMTHNGNVGLRTIEAAIKSNDDSLKTYIVRIVNHYQALVKTLERFTNWDCLQPWGVPCEKTIGGEEPCEICETKQTLLQEVAQ